MQHIAITTIQTNLAWENPEKNKAQLQKKINEVENTDVIILPEMFTTGFSMNSQKFAEPPEGKTVLWMQKNAKQKAVLLIGSLIINENKKYYNQLVCAFPNGEIKRYNKRHLFRMGNEHNHYSEGKKRLLFDYKGFKICPLICYDLRFPVWSRNTEDIDLYIYIANWPEIRVNAWNNLLLARAIENLAYVIGVNRVGEDNKGVIYSGNSVIINFKGEYLLQHIPHKEEVITTKIDKKSLLYFREKFPAYMDADKFKVLS